MGARYGLDALEKRNILWYCRELNKDTSVVKPATYTPVVYVNYKHFTGSNYAVITDKLITLSSKYARSEILKTMLLKIQVFCYVTPCRLVTLLSGRILGSQKNV